MRVKVAVEEMRCICLGAIVSVDYQKSYATLHEGLVHELEYRSVLQADQRKTITELQGELVVPLHL